MPNSCGTKAESIASLTDRRLAAMDTAIASGGDRLQSGSGHGPEVGAEGVPGQALRALPDWMAHAGVEGARTRGRGFVRGKFRQTHNFGAGPCDAGNFNTPDCPKLRPCLHSNEAHTHSRQRPASHSQASTMNGRIADNSATNTRLPPPETLPRGRKYPKLRTKIPREKFRHQTEKLNCPPGRRGRDTGAVSTGHTCG